MVDPSEVVQNYTSQRKQKEKFRYVGKQIKNQVQRIEKKQIKSLKNFKKIEKKEPEQKKETLIEPKTIKEKNTQVNSVLEEKKEVKIDTPKQFVTEQSAKKITKKKKKIKNKKESTSIDVDNLFNDLISNKSKLEKNIKNEVSTKKNNKVVLENTKSNNKLDDDIRDYARQIKLAIESQFYNAPLYTGKICILHVKLSLNGILLNIQPKTGGDPALCDAAISAARQAQIPKPPSKEVYKAFKNIPLYFKP